MVNDPARLFDKLAQFREHLLLHKDIMGGEFQELTARWNALNDVYDGEGAEEFGSAWAETMAWFERYFEELRTMESFIEERAQKLKPL